MYLVSPIEQTHLSVKERYPLCGSRSYCFSLLLHTLEKKPWVPYLLMIETQSVTLDRFRKLHRDDEVRGFARAFFSGFQNAASNDQRLHNIFC